MEAYKAHRAVLQSGFDRESKRFEGILEQELSQRDAAFESERARIQGQLDSLLKHSNEVEQENKSLRSKLERAAKRTHNTTDSTLLLPSSAASDDSGICQRTNFSLVTAQKDSDALRQSLEKKSHDYDVLKKAHARLIDRFREVKKSVEDWKNYEAKATSSVKPRGKVSDSGNSANGIKTPASTPVPRPLSTAKHPQRNHTPIVTPNTPNLFKASTDALDDPLRRSASTPHDPSVQSTRISGQQHHVSIENQSSHARSLGLTGRSEESSEGLEITSERTLKRRRAMSPQAKLPTILTDDLRCVGTSTRPIRVKSEHGSSSPLIPGTFRGLDLYQDSLDLDEVGTHITTPLKRRRLDDIANAQSKEILLASYRRRWKGHRDGTNTTSMPLQPLTPNPRVLPRESNQNQVSEAHVKRECRASVSVSAIAEDREAESSVSVGDNTMLVPKNDISNPRAVRRPRKTWAGPYGLLDNSPERSLLISGTTSNGHEKPHVRVRNAENDVEDRLSLKNSDARKAGSFSASGPLRSLDAKNSKVVGLSFPGSLGKTPSTARKEVPVSSDMPLRRRPPHQLNINDFRINPSYNQGYDYVFSDIIRDRDQRKCLPNCTKPDCCGDKFRKMVEIGGLPTSGNGDSCTSSTSVGKDTDRKLLEDFLGVDSWRLNRMDCVSLRELLIKAKAHKAANQYGKHRLFNERAASPPGFWRIDMPTTQEALADKEEAERLERQKVAERYREAVKSDGRWLFRDE